MTQNKNKKQSHVYMLTRVGDALDRLLYLKEILTVDTPFRRTGSASNLRIPRPVLARCRQLRTTTALTRSTNCSGKLSQKGVTAVLPDNNLSYGCPIEFPARYVLKIGVESQKRFAENLRK